MDGQMRALSVLVGIVFVLGTAFVVTSSDVFNYTPVSRPQVLLEQPTTSQLPRRPTQRRSRRVPPTTVGTERMANLSQLARLESLLETRTNELSDRHARIQELTRQLRELRSASATAATVSPEEGTSPPPSTLDSELREEIEHLNRELLDADIQETESQEQIAYLRESLSKATDELQLLEDGTDLQLADFRSQQRKRDGRIGELLLRLGAESIPPLIDLLDEEDPQLQLWALQVLGRFGQEAEEAIQSISTFLEDPSPELRAAAKDAVDAIEGR